MYLKFKQLEEEDHISTDNFEIPIRKRVTQVFSQLNRKKLARFGKKAAKFINKQFALIVIAFFVLSLNVVSAPVTVEGANINPLIEYEPNTVATTSRDINKYVPIIQDANPDEVADQVLSAVIGPQTPYTPKPMLAETIDHQTADRIARGLRKETVTHTVAQGETISKIADDYGLNVATILTDNDISAADAAKIKAGTQLVIAPEKTTDSIAWLEDLHAAEQKAREEKQKQAAQLAAANARKKGQVAIARAADDNTSSSSGGKGLFILPIIGERTCYNGYHTWAIDCPAPIGSTVRAAAGGTVVVADASGFNGGYGKTVLINHGNGWETRYAHMSALQVSAGQSVSRGQVLGLSGNTGNSTGPHLHFETHYNGQRINPINLVSF